jgi:hypothetical protein
LVDLEPPVSEGGKQFYGYLHGCSNTARALVVPAPLL